MTWLKKVGSWIYNNVGSILLYAAAFVAEIQGIFQVVSIPAKYSVWVQSALVTAGVVIASLERVIQLFKLPVHTVTTPDGVTMRVRAKRPIELPTPLT
jgi:hypothetical protein